MTEAGWTAPGDDGLLMREPDVLITDTGPIPVVTVWDEDEGLRVFLGNREPPLTRSGLRLVGHALLAYAEMQDPKVPERSVPRD